MEQVSWAITVASLIGTVLNIKKNKACFMIWAITNAFWAVYDFNIGAYAQAALFATYFCLALWGLWEWHREAGETEPETRSNKPAAGRFGIMQTEQTVVSVQDFRWACGHVGSAYCRQCHEQQLDALQQAEVDHVNR